MKISHHDSPPRWAAERKYAKSRPTAIRTEAPRGIGTRRDASLDPSSVLVYNAPIELGIEMELVMKKVVLVTVTLGWLLAFDPGVALAGDDAAHGQVSTRCKTKDKRKLVRSVRAAKRSYALLKINAARQTLQDAIRRGRAGGCATTLPMARALLQEAIILSMGNKQNALAQERMHEALEAHHSVQLPANQPPNVIKLWTQTQRLHAALYHSTKGAKGAQGDKPGKPGKTTRQPAAAETPVAWGRRSEALTLGFREVSYGVAPALRLRLRRTRRLAQTGDRLLKKGKLTAAYEAYRQALLLAPESVEMRERLGVVQFRLGDYSGALRTVEWIRKHAGEARADRLRSRQGKSAK